MADLAKRIPRSKAHRAALIATTLFVSYGGNLALHYQWVTKLQGSAPSDWSDVQAPRPRCSMHVVDVSTAFDLPKCDLQDQKVWPHDLLRDTHWHTILGNFSWQGQHAASLWLSTGARSHPNYVTSRESADLVVIDTSCYESWRSGKEVAVRWRNETWNDEVLGYILKGMEAATESGRWPERKGRGHLVTLHFPGLPFKVWEAYRSCGDRHFMTVAERRQFCNGNRDAALTGNGAIVPYVVAGNVPEPPIPFVMKTHLIFAVHGCGAIERTKTQYAGKLMRAHFNREVKKVASSPEVVVECACSVCPNQRPHWRLLREMGESVFCPIMPGDTQSSRRLSEAFLVGCIPVFIGAPWHTLPLADYVDYAAAGVFISVREKPWLVPGGDGWINGLLLADEMTFDGAIRSGDIHVVQTMADVLDVLRAIPEEVRRAKHHAVLAHRAFFSYQPLPGNSRSWLVDAVLEKACEASTRVEHIEPVPPSLQESGSR